MIWGDWHRSKRVDGDPENNINEDAGVSAAGGYTYTAYDRTVGSITYRLLVQDGVSVYDSADYSTASDTNAIVDGFGTVGTGASGAINLKADIDLSNLEGVRSFVSAPLDSSLAAVHQSLASGDFDGDGIDDIAIIKGTGVYVLYGSDDLSGSESVLLSGSLGGRATLAFGDFNGDGIDDLVVGNRNSATVYVIYGGDAREDLALSSLDGERGFEIAGSGQLGRAIYNAGDVNGDGYDDFSIDDSDNVNFLLYGFDNRLTRDGSDTTGTSRDDKLEGGVDASLRGGRGDDELTVTSLDFSVVDGGHGFDTLVLSGGKKKLDLTTAGVGERLQSIEAIRLEGGDNELTLTPHNLLGLSDFQHSNYESGIENFPVHAFQEDGITVLLVDGVGADSNGDGADTLVLRSEAGYVWEDSGETVDYRGKTYAIYNTHNYGNAESDLTEDAGKDSVGNDFGRLLVELGVVVTIEHDDIVPVDATTSRGFRIEKTAGDFTASDTIDLNGDGFTDTFDATSTSETSSNVAVAFGDFSGANKEINAGARSGSREYPNADYRDSISLADSPGTVTIRDGNAYFASSVRMRAMLMATTLMIYSSVAIRLGTLMLFLAMMNLCQTI